jgi:peptidylprolyl isomerase
MGQKAACGRHAGAVSRGKLLIGLVVAGMMTGASSLAATPATPSSIVAGAPAQDWADIAPSDLLVMTLAPDAKGKPRTVLIQLMPPPFSQGWVSNIRTLARAHWYDGISVVRVQDNYVVQWGDPDGEDAKKAKPLPAGIKLVPESDYTSPAVTPAPVRDPALGWVNAIEEPYGFGQFWKGWPLARDGVLPPGQARNWPVHCYGYVGVGRNMSPDTGTGAELYTVIGHAPRALDRNIAVVGRIVEGIEHLSSLPRGTGTLGFYETAAERVPILSVRLASDLPEAERPHLQYLSTESASFSRYVHVRANRKDDFFITPAGGVDLCGVAIPIRRAP